MERMCMIGVGIVYPDGFATVDLIVRGEQFEAAKNIIGDINAKLERNPMYAETFNPESDYVKELDRQKIDSYVLTYTADATDDEDERANIAQFFVDLEYGK